MTSLTPQDFVATWRKTALTERSSYQQHFLDNARPAWLDTAHEKLDAAVCDAYGWPHDLTDEQILERLLALNLERAATQGGSVAAVADEDESEN